MNASVATLWTLFTTVAAIPEWYEGWDQVEHDPSLTTLGPGATFNLVRRNQARTEVVVCRVIDFEPPTALSWSETDDAGEVTYAAFGLRPSPGGGTSVAHAKGPHPGRLVSD